MKNGAYEDSFETLLRRNFHIERDDLRDPDLRNPFLWRIRIFAVLTIAALVGAVFYAIAHRKEVTIFMIVCTLFLAFMLLLTIRSYREFNRRHEKYASGETVEEEIRAEMLRILINRENAEDE
jgi:hypothetical protein